MFQSSALNQLSAGERKSDVDSAIIVCSFEHCKKVIKSKIECSTQAKTARQVTVQSSYVMECVRLGPVLLQYIPTAEQLADILRFLTKLSQDQCLARVLNWVFFFLVSDAEATSAPVLL